MNICPPGFFCFDKNTFILLIIFVIIFVIYYINNSSSVIFKHSEIVSKTQNKLNDLSDAIKINANHIDKIDNRGSIDKQIYTIAKDQHRITNPLLAPERSYPNNINRVGIPINISTRGESPNYQQVGALYGNNKILPLYGKPTYNGSRNWLYYSSADNYAGVKIPISINGKSSQDEYGLSELYNDDTVDVTGYGNTFKVEIYNLDKPKYIPYIY